jgi:rhodanese-related sulfurtransferase
MNLVAAKSLIMQVVSILAVTTLLALAANALSPLGISVTRALTLRELDARYITAEETKARHEAGQSLFLDARRAEHFARGHIAGAQSIPGDEFDQRFVDMAAWLPKEAEIVIYCDGKSCGLGRQVADKLAPLGYTRIVIFRDGWAGWKERGWPVEQ